MFKVQKPLYKSVFQSELNSYKQLDITDINPELVVNNVPLTQLSTELESVQLSTELKSVQESIDAVENVNELSSINTSEKSINNKSSNELSIELKGKECKVIDNLSRFFDVVETLTRRRSEYPKKTYYNVLYKFIANAGIGQMARGLNQKTSFDTKSGTNIVTSAGPLINPLYGGWITSFIRTVLAEIMNNVHNQGGRIISCTTDGFISDMSGLDSMNIDGPNCEFARMYKEARLNLLKKRGSLARNKIC